MEPGHKSAQPLFNVVVVGIAIVVLVVTDTVTLVIVTLVVVVTVLIVPVVSVITGGRVLPAHMYVTSQFKRPRREGVAISAVLQKSQIRSQTAAITKRPTTISIIPFLEAPRSLELSEAIHRRPIKTIISHPRANPICCRDLT
jgi:hypothetical protein